MLMSIGVVDLGFHGVFGVPGIFSLWVPVVVTLGVPGKFFLLDTDKVFFVPGGSMFTIFCTYSLRPKP